MIKQINNKSIVKNRTIEIPLDALWKKWTTTTGLKTFFGAENKMELSIGGPFEIYFMMENPYGTRGSEGCQVLSFLPQKMLSFSWNAPPHFEAIRNGSHHTWVVVEMEVVSDNQTKISLTHLGWLDGNDWEEVYAYFEKAWDMVMDNLVASC